VPTAGKLLASGRDSDIFEYGANSVLRRARSGRSMALEAQTMRYLAERGYPVPIVEDLSDDGCDLVMQRIDGLSMVDVLGRSPWTVFRQADTLADLHRRLHVIPAPGFLPASPISPGGSILHLDLHPLNVLISARGPVVIDWTGACVGNPNSDVALTWLMMSAGDIPGSRLRARLLGFGRSLLTDRFFRSFDRADVVSQLNAAATWKASDKNLSEEEIAGLWRAVHRRVGR
jgi:aminoglycoside phosphotransferase (APT) family kinase protein